MSEAGVDTGRLRWHCRRGMQELDLLLQRYLHDGWPEASSAERADFVAFLGLPDPELASYLLRGDTVPAPYAALVARICDLSAAAARASRRAAGED